MWANYCASVPNAEIFRSAVRVLRTREEQPGVTHNVIGGLKLFEPTLRRLEWATEQMQRCFAVLNMTAVVVTL